VRRCVRCAVVKFSRKMIWVKGGMGSVVVDVTVV
jgi:hypothetical protein